VNHPHVDLLQLHRADNLSFDDEDPIVVKLTGSEHDSLSSLFRDSVNLSGKIERYRTGFLHDYGYFARYASPPYEGHVVTFVQAYSSSAKMVRFADIGLVAAYTVCRGFHTGDRLLDMRENETRQHVKDIESYCKSYIRHRQCLRIEEVLTFDRLRLDETISNALTHYHVFDDNERCIITSEMIHRGLLYRLNNWRLYYDSAISVDVRFLHNVIIHCEALNQFPWTPPPIVRQTIRSIIRIMYFVHGNSPEYNYQIMQHMFANGTEGQSNDNGIVRLRPLRDESDDFLYPLYSKKIPVREINVARHVWTVICGISKLHDQDDENDDHVFGDDWLVRMDVQYHWRNPGTWHKFDDYLTAMDHKHRKNIRQERRKVEQAGVQFRVVHGDEATPDDLHAMHHFYRQTFADYGNTPALTLEFLHHLAAQMPRQLVLILAQYNRKLIAGALYLRGTDTLYGRYWGTLATSPGLHFETCYYQGIEYCLREGLTIFEPGAQGEHKIARGFLPAMVRSRHWIAEPGFHAPLRRWCAEETASIHQYARTLASHSPFRKNMDSAP